MKPLNAPQKRLTVVFLGLFALTLLFAPFDVERKDESHSSATLHRPVFAPPDMEGLANRRVAPALVYTWAGLALLFFGFHAFLQSPEKQRNGGGGGGGGGRRQRPPQGFRNRRPSGNK